MKPKYKSLVIIIRTQENYREVSKTILRLKPELRIFSLILFNTGGTDLPGARVLSYQEQPLASILILTLDLVSDRFENLPEHLVKVVVDLFSNAL